MKFGDRVNGNNYDARAEFYARRKKRERKNLIRRLLLIFITAVVGTSVILLTVAFIKLFNPTQHDSGFVPWVFGTNVSKKVEKAQNLQMPDFIEKDFIHKHNTARSGIMLTDIKNIVVHYVGNPNTTAKNNRDYFDKESTTVSSHFIVGLDGEIIQCLPIYEKSAASNNRNKDTVSIEVCHPDESGKFNNETYESVIKLCTFLCYEFNLDFDDVIRHYDITGKNCPNYYVENEEEWETFRQNIKERLKEYGS